MESENVQPLFPSEESKQKLLPDENSKVSQAAIKNISKLVILDRIALDNWRTIKDDLVERAIDSKNLSIKARHEFDEVAIRRSLEIWSNNKSKNATYANLLTILKSHGLNHLAEQIESNFKKWPLDDNQKLETCLEKFETDSCASNRRSRTITSVISEWLSTSQGKIIFAILLIILLIVGTIVILYLKGLLSNKTKNPTTMSDLTIDKKQEKGGFNLNYTPPSKEVTQTQVQTVNVNINGQDRFEEKSYTEPLPKELKLKFGIWWGLHNKSEHRFEPIIRAKELAELDEKLKNIHSTSSELNQMIVITGLGGVGKSTLASLYAKSFSQYYHNNVVWINAETINSIRDGFTKFTKYLRLPFNETMTNQELALNVYAWFHDSKCLFIFDNVEQKEHIVQFLPRGLNPAYNKPYILVTSQRHDLVSNSKQIFKLGNFGEDDAIKFIMDNVQNCAKADAKLLASTLGYLPIALEQAIAYINNDLLFETNVSTIIHNYIKEYQQVLFDGGNNTNNNNNNVKTTMKTFTITLQKLENETHGSSAIQLLQLISFMNPEFISFEFLTEFKTPNLKQSLQLLKKFSIITLESSIIQIHRLVQDVVQLKLTSQEQKVIIESITKIIANEMIGNIDQTHQQHSEGFIGECTSHLLHLFTIKIKSIDPLEDNEKSMLNLAEYSIGICNYLNMNGKYQSSLSLALKTVEKLNSKLGPKNYATLKMNWILAEAYFLLDRYTEALRILESITVQAKSTPNVNDEFIRNVTFSISTIHSVQNGQAYKYLQFGLESSAHLDTMYTKANSLIKAEVKLNEALAIFKVVYSYENLHLGVGHPNTLITKSRIAVTLYYQNKLEASLNLWKSILKYREKLYSSNHVAIIECEDWIEAIEDELE